MSLELSQSQLLAKVLELKSLLRKYWFELSMGRLSNCMKIRTTKKEIARTYTKISQMKKMSEVK